MQRRLFSLLLAVFLLLTVLCGGNESLSVFNGKMVVATAPIVKDYEAQTYLYHLRHDSLKWVYEYPEVGESRVNLIVGGHIATDSIDPDFGDTIPLKIGENHLALQFPARLGEASGVHQIAFDTNGIFLDTIPVAVSPNPGVVLPCTTFLAINAGEFVTDTILLFGPHPEVDRGVTP